MSLSINWLTEKWIDFEYKKFQLLAYLQEVRSQYSLSRIYPALADVISHYKNLLSYRENSLSIQKGCSKQKLTGIDWQHLQLQYAKPDAQHEILEEIQQIVDYAVPLFYEQIKEGQSIYDVVESNLRFSAVGITPLKTDEGYLLLSKEMGSVVYVYRYQLSFYTTAVDNFRSLVTTPLGSWSVSNVCSFEKLKIDLISEHKELPNPAVFSVVCTLDIPLQETLLPVAKRFLVRKFFR
jgi:hypothetical protein